MKSIFIFLLGFVALVLNANEKVKLETPLDNGAQYGWAVDISGEFIAIAGPGYYYHMDNVTYRCGSVLVFQQKPNGKYTFLQRLLPPDPSVRGTFGSSLTIHKNQMLVADAFDKLDPKSISGSDAAGAVYAFNYDAKKGRWVFVNKIVKSDRTSRDRFGEEVALNDSIGVITTGGVKQGGLFVVKKNAMREWEVVNSFSDGLTKIGGIDLHADQLIFASNISLEREEEMDSGKWRVTTASIDHKGGLSNFEEVEPIHKPKGRKFGKAALQVSGEFCFVASYFEPENGDRLSNRGNVHVFKTDSSSGNWKQTQKIVSPDFNKVDFFGSSIDFQGDYLIVGALGDNFNMRNERVVYMGGAYVYQLESDSLVLKTKITAPDKEWNKFGFSVSVDAETFVVGSRLESYEDSIKNAGGAYVFELER